MTPGLKLLSGPLGGDWSGVNQRSIKAKEQSFSVQLKGWCLPGMLRSVISRHVHLCLLPLSWGSHSFCNYAVQRDKGYREPFTLGTHRTNGDVE